MSVDARTEEFEHIELFGKPALFTNYRIDQNTVPKGWYCYDFRGSDSDPGKLNTVEPRVVVNHSGAVLLPEGIDMKGKELTTFCKMRDMPVMRCCKSDIQQRPCHSS